jgi:glycosyltransferase involved in cell wall biosynthesis
VNVAAVTLDTINAMYRVRLPLLAMQALGHGTYEERGRSIQRPDILMRSDVVLFYRHWDASARAMARRLSDAGIGVVFDNDDDVAAIPRDVAGYRRSGGVRGHAIMNEIRGMVREAHLMTTTTETLADRFRGLSETEVRPIDNYVPPDWFVAPRALPEAEVVVGWVAGNEHQLDFQRLGLGDVFMRLLDDHPNLRIKSVGLGLGLRSPRYERVRAVPFDQLTKTGARFDIGIAPLADIPFNHCRSSVKVKEYACAGIPWVASDVGPYRALGPDQGGVVVSNDDWYSAIARLAQDAGQRRRLARQGQSWARAETIEVHAMRWHDAFADAIERAGRPRPADPPNGVRPPSSQGGNGRLRSLRILSRRS